MTEKSIEEIMQEENDKYVKEAEEDGKCFTNCFIFAFSFLLASILLPYIISYFLGYL